MRIALCLAGLLLPFGCAQVPKESVELSTTVGRDIAEAHKSHRATAELLFGRMKDDVHRFIDDVYLPYQIRNTLGPLQNELFGAIREAADDQAENQAVKNALTVLELTVDGIAKQVASYRAELLGRIEAQEKQVLAKIDGHYNQLHYANSIVTGHLASVRKVHDAQEEILEKFGFEDLRGAVGTRLAELSTKVGEVVGKALRGEEKIDAAQEALEKLLADGESPADAGGGTGGEVSNDR